VRTAKIFAVLLLILTSVAARSASAQSVRWGAGYIPNVPVVTQEGKPLKFYDDVIKGKIVVVSFIYTSCKDICPLVTGRLALARERLSSDFSKNVQFVSVSIDPETDTPEKLKEHAAAFGAGPDWLFLTGNRRDIDAIRHKLGERSKTPNQHRSEILLGNDATGEWARDSVFGDLGVLAANIQSMDPVWRANIDKSHLAALTARSHQTPGHQPGQGLFLKLCATCHTIGKGDRAGPDLGGLFSRRDRTWVERYIAHPEDVRAADDPIAAELVARFPRLRMPNLGISPNDSADLMSYLESNVAAHLVKSGHKH
jgi:protein SCO1/2